MSSFVDFIQGFIYMSIFRLSVAFSRVHSGLSAQHRKIAASRYITRAHAVMYECKKSSRNELKRACSYLTRFISFVFWLVTYNFLCLYTSVFLYVFCSLLSLYFFSTRSFVYMLLFKIMWVCLTEHFDKKC